MKTILAYVRQRRWCQVLLAGMILFFLALLHPRGRDTIFGQINGWSRSTWEAEIRASARREKGMQPPSWYSKTLEKLGIRPHHEMPDWSDERLLPIFLDLAEDRDERVRCYCLHSLDQWKYTHHAAVVRVYRQHLQDSDPRCRLSAAEGLWKATRDPEVKAVLLPLAKHRDPGVRYGAGGVMCQMVPDVPDLIEPLSDLAEGPDEGLRDWAALALLRKVDKPRLSIIRKSLEDGDLMLRLEAVWAASRLGKDAAELIPELRAIQRNDPDEFLRDHAARVLRSLDSNRFPPQK